MPKWKRGDLWIGSDRGDYAKKPRPVLIMQDDSLASDLESVIVCPFTTHREHSGATRIPVEPSSLNGLDEPSMLQIDKIAAMRSTGLDKKIGQLDETDLARAETAVAMILGLRWWLPEDVDSPGSPRPPVV